MFICLPLIPLHLHSAVFLIVVLAVFVFFSWDHPIVFFHCSIDNHFLITVLSFLLSSLLSSPVPDSMSILVGALVFFLDEVSKYGGKNDEVSKSKEKKMLKQSRSAEPVSRQAVEKEGDATPYIESV